MGARYNLYVSGNGGYMIENTDYISDPQWIDPEKSEQFDKELQRLLSRYWRPDHVDIAHS